MNIDKYLICEDIIDSVGTLINKIFKTKNINSMMTTINNPDGVDFTKMGLNLKGFSKQEIKTIQKEYHDALTTALDNDDPKGYKPEKGNFSGIRYFKLEHGKDLQDHLIKVMTKKLKGKVNFNK